MFKYAWLLLLGVLLSSCMTADAEKRLQELTAPGSAEDLSRLQQEQEQREVRQLVLERIESIRRQILEGKLATAEENLQPLKSLPDYAHEVENLQALIDLARGQQRKQPDRDLSRNRMLAEVEDRLQLPESYGKVAVIDSSLAPVVLPPGKMEELCNRRISVNMDSVGISELVDVLSREGLNVVADEALKQEGKVLAVRVNDIPLKDLFAYFARNMGIAFHIGNDLVWITKGEEKGGPPLETRIIRLRQGTIPKVPVGSPAPGAVLGDLPTPTDEEDNDLEEALTAFFAGSPEGAAFRLFRNRNILMVRDSRENLRLVESIVEELDQPPYQVAIEAKFITVSQDDLRDLGVEWTKYSGGKAADNNLARNPDPLGTHGKGALQVSNFLSELAASATAAEIGKGSMTLSGVIGDRTFDVLISAIEKKNSSVTLSAPRVTVMNNRTARIRKGNTYYYFEEYDTATVNKGDARGDVEVLVPSGTPIELPVGITFDVKVNIGNDGKTVLLGLKPSIVSFLGWEDYISAGTEDEDDGKNKNKEEKEGTTIGQIRLPRIHEQVAMTTVGVNSGETVVMGGMIDNSISRNVKKVPFLGDLPLIGFLFRRTETMNIPTNLLIFVTAHVVNSRGEYLDVRVQDALP
ncbi:MAG: hypothetical protein GX902_10470 [Lentisphaerae bacterium]|jgi:type IV pilus assembly protein PilQ|nr:hypothetical protein [Lentisphaerota bacterium]